MKLINLTPLVLIFTPYLCNKIERVIFIGLDGAGSFHKLINVPTITSLLKSGVYSNYASAMYPTISGENWGSMLHGVIPKKHGLTNEIVENNSYPEDSDYPSIFKIIQAHNSTLKLASFAAWAPINEGIIEKSVSMHRVWRKTDDEIIIDMIDYLKTDGKSTAFTFFYFLDIDEIGHKHYWMSSEYIKRFKMTDEYIKQILNTLEDLKLRETTLIVITSDHGGILWRHGSLTPVEKSVLFGISGPGVPRRKLDGRFVRNMDIAAVVLKALNIPIPKYFDSKVPRF
jgi:predicted AlkP superfamily pyrophosphatase or phosphodiesterase